MTDLTSITGQGPRLYYLVGASGSGKDSIINLCRQMIRIGDQVLFADRYITREEARYPEIHIPLTQQEYDNKLDSGEFAMAWDAHGVHYGIGKEIEEWMNNDYDVILNGSRAYLEAATNRYGNLVPVLVEASEDNLRERLEVHDRETEEDLEDRIQRAIDFAGHMPENSIVINNDGSLESACQQLLSVIRMRHDLAMGAEQA